MNPKSIIILFCFMMLSTASICAQVKTYNIQKTTEKIRIDGFLNETSWENTELATDFVQWIPDPMEDATQKTIVRLLYDETAVYISAVLYQEKSTIRKQLTPRDGIGNANADLFGVYFDTYSDKQNGFAFKVTAAGSKQEERLINGGSEGTGDVSWDAVWTSKVRRTDTAWIVEMQIPFQAIRFPKMKYKIGGFNL